MPWQEDLKFPRGYQMGTHISNYSKSKDVFELIVGNSKQAIENSKKLEDYQLSNGTIDRIKKIPYTDV